MLRKLVLGCRLTQAIYVAAELGIADLLADGPRSAVDRAGVVAAHAPSLYRVMRLLASEGVFAETQDRQFVLIPMADLLRRDAPVSSRPMVLFNASSGLWQSWVRLLHAVRTGKPAFDQASRSRLLWLLQSAPRGLGGLR
jgi:hypothetical protein